MGPRWTRTISWFPRILFRAVEWNLAFHIASRSREISCVHGVSTEMEMICVWFVYGVLKRDLFPDDEFFLSSKFCMGFYGIFWAMRSVSTDLKLSRAVGTGWPSQQTNFSLLLHIMAWCKRRLMMTNWGWITLSGIYTFVAEENNVPW